MKKFLLLSLFGLCFANLTVWAQPTIDDAIIPAPGDSIPLVVCQPIDFQVNAIGPNQTWDFSNLTPDPVNPDYHFKYIEPSETPYIDRYPDADIVAVNADGQWAYYTYDGTTLLIIGVVAPDQMLGDGFGDYIDPEVEEIFPIAFNNTWFDEFDGTNFIGGFSSDFTGMVDGVVEGYGTLILPNGTFQNVLRIREERESQIAGAPVTNVSTLYRYLSADQQLWLLSMESFPSGPPIIHYNKNPEVISSTQQVSNQSFNIQLVPNPISAGHAFQVIAPEQTIRELQLLNALGQKISQPVSIRSVNSESTEVSLPADLWPGIYLLHGQVDGMFFSKKIV
ncbi:MAG: T9SS type A sorting domain-containing protein, partial [Bacteroidota bacterium]